MTDGQDGSDAGQLKRAVDTLKLVVSGLKGAAVTIHVIGFGEYQMVYRRTRNKSVPLFCRRSEQRLPRWRSQVWQ
jgi:hypothetical protein